MCMLRARPAWERAEDALMGIGGGGVGGVGAGDLSEIQSVRDHLPRPRAEG